MSDPSHAGVTPPPPGTPAIPVSPTSDNPPGLIPPGAAPPGPPPGAPAPWQTGAPQVPGHPPQPQPGAPAWGQQGYGAPPPPPQPRQPNPAVESLKRELTGQFPAPTDAAQGKTWAMLCYLPGVFIPIWLIPLVKRTNHLSLFHAKQMLGFAAIQAVMWTGFIVLRLLVGLIKHKVVSGVLGWMLLGGLLFAFLAVAIVGLIGAMRGQVKPLPLIGRTIDRMTRGLTVVPPTPNAEPQLAYWERVAPAAARPAAPTPPAAAPAPMPPAVPPSAPPPGPTQP